MIERFFLDVSNGSASRRVHVRRFGKGPPLLMIHQSPRSSAEYEPLMYLWGDHFTCIAPDTPGFGQSDPLPGATHIHEFGDALLDTMDALGLGSTAAYGSHSGATVLMDAIKRAPHRFQRAALGGYAVWTEAERVVFATDYLPPYCSSPYGEHLTWLWNRVLEQSWFFPWFDTRPGSRLALPSADVDRVHAIVMEVLDAGDAYRAGYGAALRAELSIPLGSLDVPPTLITAYDGDPLQSHIARLGELPYNWEAFAVRTIDDHHAVSLKWLLRHHTSGETPRPVIAADEGFLVVNAGKFAGRIHWHGKGDTLRLHAPGAESQRGEEIAIDLPGHGLSDAMSAGSTSDDWLAVVTACTGYFGTHKTIAEGATAVLTGHSPQLNLADAERLLPDLTVDRFGGHLARAWSAARASRFFDPWYMADATHARPFIAAEVDPAAIDRDARALLRARSGRALLNDLSKKGH